MFNMLNFYKDYKHESVAFEELKGKRLKSIDILPYEDGKVIVFCCSDDDMFALYHGQECCEDVWLEDVCGDLDDLIESDILIAEFATNQDEPIGEPYNRGLVEKGQDFTNHWRSLTWSFYKLATIKGYVTFTWKGMSNGYYSEKVAFSRLIKRGG